MLTWLRVNAFKKIRRLWLYRQTRSICLFSHSNHSFIPKLFFIWSFGITYSQPDGCVASAFKIRLASLSRSLFGLVYGRWQLVNKGHNSYPIELFSWMRKPVCDKQFASMGEYHKRPYEEFLQDGLEANG